MKVMKNNAQFTVSKIIANNAAIKMDPGRTIHIRDFFDMRLLKRYRRDAVSSAVRRCCGHRKAWLSKWNGMLEPNFDKHGRAVSFIVSARASEIFEAVIEGKRTKERVIHGIEPTPQYASKRQVTASFAMGRKGLQVVADLLDLEIRKHQHMLNEIKKQRSILDSIINYKW